MMLNLLHTTMLCYITKDIEKELEYLPYALLLYLLEYFAIKIILLQGSKNPLFYQNNTLDLRIYIGEYYLF